MANETAQLSTGECVLRLALEMERKLSMNRHKGDRAGWLAKSGPELWEMFRSELDELMESIELRLPPRDVLQEAADVANVAMMLADRYAHNYPIGVAENPSRSGESADASETRDTDTNGGG